jgi:hypothetical protein
MLILNTGKNRRYSAMQFNDTYSGYGIPPHGHHGGHHHGHGGGGISTIFYPGIMNDIYDTSVDNCPDGKELQYINGVPTCVRMQVLQGASLNYSGWGLHIITNDKPY